jgi:cytochrome c biogenesis protein CcmG/thiol:disulfide interchange protein DsbE
MSKQQPQPKHWGKYLLPALGGVLVVFGVVALIASRINDNNTTSSGSTQATDENGLHQTQPVEVDGEALPQFVSSDDDPAIGMTIPTVNGASFDGTPVTISPSDGAQLLMFVAHWCPHCQREVPLVSEWLKEGKLPEGVKLVTVATGTTPAADNYPPSAWLEKNDWPQPILADDELGSAARAFGLSAYPYFVVVDGDGKVVARQSGEVPIEELQKLVAKTQPT